MKDERGTIIRELLDRYMHSMINDHLDGTLDSEDELVLQYLVKLNKELAQEFGEIESWPTLMSKI
jgi:hypothetical protein